MVNRTRIVGIKAKVKRAKEHVNNLASDRYVITPDRDPKTGDDVFHIHVNDLMLPLQISVIAGEIIHDLRSALDRLAWQLVDANGGKLGRHVQFPVFEEPHTIEKYEAKVERMIEGASNGAMRLVKSVQAYDGGNAPYLYIIHALNNLDKHRLLLATGIARIGPSGWKLVEEGAEIYRIPAHMRNTLPMDMDTQVSIDVTLREVGLKASR